MTQTNHFPLPKSTPEELRKPPSEMLVLKHGHLKTPHVSQHTQPELESMVLMVRTGACTPKSTWKAYPRDYIWS